MMETQERPRAMELEIARALSPHPFGMDILVYTPQEIESRVTMGDYFLREIVTQGQVLYERHPL